MLRRAEKEVMYLLKLGRLRSRAQHLSWTVVDAVSSQKEGEYLAEDTAGGKSLKWENSAAVGAAGGLLQLLVRYTERTGWGPLFNRP